MRRPQDRAMSLHTSVALVLLGGALLFGTLVQIAGALEISEPLEHLLAETLPVLPRFKEWSEENGKEYSWSHCFSSSMQTYAWRSNACFLQNLCFNSTSKEFLFYTTKDHHAPDNVSIGTFNYKWGSQYDKTMNFVPKVVVGQSIPRHRLMAPGNDLWVPYLPFCPANIGHLVWDDYLTLFLLSWAAKPVMFGESESFSLRPFWYNPPNDPPWATCDWIRLHEGPGHSLPAGYSNRCIKNNDRWLPLLLGKDNHVLPETASYKFPGTESSDLVCFPKAAYGITPFANQASGHHGWNPEEGIAPAFGRAPLMFDFTRHMMRKIGAVDLPRKSLKEIIIFFSSRSSDRIAIDFSRHADAITARTEMIEKAVHASVGHDRLKVVVKHEVLYQKSALEQVNLAASACVYVTAAGGGAFTAQFLPRGSSIILYHHKSGEHLHKGRVDWKVFNSASWMRSTYLESSESQDVEKLTGLITNEVMNCVAFMEALDV